MKTLRRTAGGSRLALGAAALAAALMAFAPATLAARMTPPGSLLDSNVMRVAPKTLLSVTNDNWLDVHLYLVRDGEPFSLGVVTGPGNQVLDLPSLATIPGGRVQILALPIGGVADFLSPEVTVNPGDVVHLTVANNLDLSTLTVEPGS